MINLTDAIGVFLSAWGTYATGLLALSGFTRRGDCTFRFAEDDSCSTNVPSSGKIIHSKALDDGDVGYATQGVKGIGRLFQIFVSLFRYLEMGMVGLLDDGIILKLGQYRELWTQDFLTAFMKCNYV